MNRIKTVDRLYQGKLSRREFNEALGVFGVSLVTVPSFVKPARAAGDILYFTWAGFENPNLFPAYAEKYGTPDAAFFGDEYEAIEKLKAGFEADVVAPCIDVMPRWMGSNMQPIDESRLTHLGNLFEVVHDPEAAFHNGERYFVPTFWGFTSIVYRPDLVDITLEEESWTLLYDERFKGKIAIWDSTDAVIPAASLALGYTDDPYRPSGERLEKVGEMMRKQRDLVRFYWGSSTELIQALGTGEVVISLCWGSTPPRLKEAGIPFKWAFPKEGLISFNCGVARSNRKGDVAAVHDFIDASISPEAGKYMIETFAYGASNKKSFGMVDKALLAEMNFSTPEESLAGSHAFQYVPPDIKQQHIELFDLVKAGS